MCQFRAVDRQNVMLAHNEVVLCRIQYRWDEQFCKAAAMHGEGIDDGQFQAVR